MRISGVLGDGNAINWQTVTKRKILAMSPSSAAATASTFAHGYGVAK
jgi:hypothetical protein